MKTRLLTGGAMASCIVAVLAAGLVSTAGAQNAAPAASATAAAVATPRTRDGQHPDLSGFWVRGVAGIPGYGKEPLGQASNLVRTADGSIFLNYNGTVPPDPASGPVPPPPPQPVRTSPSYKPEYAVKVAAIMATMNGNATPLDPMQSCKPLGVPRAGLGIDEHLMIVQGPNTMAFMWEADPGPVYRVIYKDGRPHPPDVDTSFMGHSIGHWEGDTLVVDVVGLNDETWVGGGNQGPRNATIHSDKEHVIERWTRKGNELTYEATVEDPVMFTEPWVMTPQTARLAAPGDWIQPTMCLNRDKDHLVPPDPAPAR